MDGAEDVAKKTMEDLFHGECEAEVRNGWRRWRGGKATERKGNLRDSG